MSKTISHDVVCHIAKLARIELADAEVEPLGHQLAKTLEYFDKLAELDTEGAEPMAHAIELSNVLGADESRPSLTPQQALANAPARDGDFFKVPKVIGDSQ